MSVGKITEGLPLRQELLLLSVIIIHTQLYVLFIGYKLFIGLQNLIIHRNYPFRIVCIFILVSGALFVNPFPAAIFIQVFIFSVATSFFFRYNSTIQKGGNHYGYQS
jgi:hypothetical protein